jgi:hypothetical protein
MRKFRVTLHSDTEGHYSMRQGIIECPSILNVLIKANKDIQFGNLLWSFVYRVDIEQI